MNARRIDSGDLDYMVRVDTDPHMQATLLGRLSTQDETQARLERWLDEARKSGLGFWLFTDRVSGEAIGHGGLFSSPRVEGFLELGYAIVPPAWGKGYATEMGEKLRAIARSLDLPPLLAMTRATNLPSRRVLEKIGFIYERDEVLKEILYARYAEATAVAT